METNQERGWENIILDVDGTLWNTTEIVAKAWNQAIEADGRSAVRVDGARLRLLFGKPMNVIGELLFTDVNETIREKLLEDCCQLEQITLREGKEKLLYPGVARTMCQLVQEQQKKLFIVSNCQSGYIELFLERNRLEEYVTDIECFGNTGKGKGENIKNLMARNGLSASETLYVGDTAGDQEASKEAGIPFVFAAYGFGEVKEYDIRIQEFQELLRLS